MSEPIFQAAAALAAAWLAGGLIGVERSYHGRAGFRTHSLVSIGAAAAILVGWGHPDAMSRLGQGVITGIGFLGAGVIFKEGISIQGLTTAASVWATAAIGLLFGAGDYAAGGLATGAVLAILIVLRWIEEVIPARAYALATFRFKIEGAPDRSGLDRLLATHGVTLREVSYGRAGEGQLIEFKGVVSAARDRVLDDLADSLRDLDNLREFQLERISK